MTRNWDAEEETVVSREHYDWAFWEAHSSPAAVAIDGFACLVSRGGYTGPCGFDEAVYLAAASAQDLAAAMRLAFIPLTANWMHRTEGTGYRDEATAGESAIIAAAEGVAEGRGSFDALAEAINAEWGGKSNPFTSVTDFGRVRDIVSRRFADPANAEGWERSYPETEIEKELYAKPFAEAGEYLLSLPPADFAIAFASVFSRGC